MSTRADHKRKTQFEEVLSAAVRLDCFSHEEIRDRCREAKAIFVANVLKQLTSERVLGLVRTDTNAHKYAWLQPAASFDIQRWIASQLSHGTQVSNSPVEERPRERLLQLGAAALKTSELLAILIRSGLKGESAVQAGQKLANQFDNQLQQLPLRAPSELKEISRAISAVPYCQIMAGVELGRRVAEATQANAPKVRINSTQAARAYCLQQFARLAHDSRQEEFHIVTLDTKLQPIQSHQITVGTLDASLVHPREVFRPAIRDAASSVLLIHNHPSGDPTPSRQDFQVTERMKSAGELLGISVIDHIVIARDQAVSIAEA